MHKQKRVAIRLTTKSNNIEALKKIELLDRISRTLTVKSYDVSLNLLQPNN